MTVGKVSAHGNINVSFPNELNMFRDPHLERPFGLPYIKRSAQAGHQIDHSNRLAVDKTFDFVKGSIWKVFGKCCIYKRAVFTYITSICAHALAWVPPREPPIVALNKMITKGHSFPKSNLEMFFYTLSYPFV